MWREVADPLGLVIETGRPLVGVVDDQEVVHLAVERQVRQQAVGLDLGALGLLAEGGIGMDLLHQTSRRERVAEGETDVVPALEEHRCPPRPFGLEGGDQLTRGVELGRRTRGEPGGPGVGPGVGSGQGQRGEICHLADATAPNPAESSPADPA